MNTLNEENGKNNFMVKIKESFSGRKFKSGAYVTAVTTVVIVIIFVINLLVTQMNIQFDLSSNDMYTLSEETENYLKGLDSDITIYYMIQQGNETVLYDRIAKQYERLSDRISYEHKDPVLYPRFAEQYVTDEVAQNSFIVVNNDNGRAKYVAGSDLLVQELNYNTYQMETTGIDVEGKLTSALQYVTTEDLPVMYITEGHGEATAASSFTEAIEKLNIESNQLATLSAEAVPEDCDILYINSPQKDFSDEETAMIKDYLAAGGKAIFITDYNAAEFPNLVSILDYYGIKLVQGIVLEGDIGKYVSGMPNYIIPDVESHDATSLAYGNNIPVFMPIASGLMISDSTRSSLTVEPLLTTSDKAYAKTNIESTNAEKEEGDIDGPFYLGLAATDTYNNVTASLVVYSCGYTFSDETSSYGNSYLLSSTIGYLAGDTTALSIPTKSLAGDAIYPSPMQQYAWGIITSLVIPIAIFIFGAVICYKRRRK